MFSLIKTALKIHAHTTTPAENDALDDIAIIYLGAPLSGHKYGLYTKLTFPSVFTIAIVTAFFSGVCPSTCPHHDMQILLTPYVAAVKIIIATYLAATLVVLILKMKPTIAITFETVICQVRSLYLPELQQTRILVKQAKRYGGHVRTRVIVVLKPKVLTTLGKKFLNPFAVR